jgi:chromosome segregation ATPase
MNCANKALVVLLVVVSLGVWGCSQGGNSGSSSARLRDLESRHAKLEEDYRATVAARDLARKRAAVLEEERTQLREQVARAAREAENLRQQVAARSGERDTLQAQLVQFGKDLHGLVSRVDSAVGVQPTPPVTTTGPSLETREQS